MIEPRQYRVFQRSQLDRIEPIQSLSGEDHEALLAVSAVLPFRVNNYVIEDLIDWNNIPADPIFQLTFPQREMLDAADFETMLALVRSDAPASQLRSEARRIQASLNPHPAGQLDFNVPSLDGHEFKGIQHKYRETLLFFPAQGQTCHAYCTYCFRWAQFVGVDDLKFVETEADGLVRYLRAHPEVTDVLFTGGDPMVMSTKVLRRYVEPILDAGLDSVRTLRFGTKAPAYWPYRFTTGEDADELMRLFEQIVDSGRHVALMAHFSHPRELETEPARAALRRIHSTGATVRCQAPLIRHVNDDADAWSRMWQAQVELGAVPYYMFVERDTGARNYFGVPLAEAHDIFRTAFRKVSGLARTVRGPSMSTTPGKVLIDGVQEFRGERVFALRFLQGRDSEWTDRVFYARFDPQAEWLDDLKPAAVHRGEPWFFEPHMRRLRERSSRRVISELGA